MLFRSRCRSLLLLETCVSRGNDEAINLVSEPVTDPTQAFHGTGCRPTRPWVFNRLREHFAHCYVPSLQPAHEEFPTDWTVPNPNAALSRAIFVASREPLIKPHLLDYVPDVQTRC